MAAYIHFSNKVEGPCEIKGHEKWIVMESWTWEATREVSGGNQIGMASGVAKFGALQFAAPVGSATIAMFIKMVAGQHFDLVQIECTKNTGALEPEVWLKLELEHVLVTKINQNVTEEEANDDIEIMFSQIKMNIKDQGGDGKLDKSGKDFVYDITTATQTAK